MSVIANDRRSELIEVMLEMSQVMEESELYRLIVDGAAKLVPGVKAWYGKFYPETGDIKIEYSNAESTTRNSTNLRWGLGISGTAIQQGKSQVVENVYAKQWENIYLEHWMDTVSEIAIPVMVEKVAIRVGQEVKKIGLKKIGVLNLESNQKNIFTEDHIELLKLLASHAALLIDRLDYEKKMQGVREIEQKISEFQINNAAHKKIIDFILKGIDDVLGFSHINISLVDPLRTYIRSEHFYNKYETEARLEEFKQESIHPLTNKMNQQDIDADIIFTKKIEAPSPNHDPRFDKFLFEKYNHKHLIRVFIPMIDPATRQAIGTFAAGYRREYVNQVFERDIQLLNSFVDYAIHAIVSHRGSIIEQVIHEIRAPIFAIRSHADLLQAYWFSQKSRPDVIANKLQDILTDSEILFQNTSELENLLIGGREGKKLNLENTLIYRDIILKTVYLMKPVMQEYGLSSNNIEFNIPEEFKKIRIFTDKNKLNQVIYNLITNAIKYHDKDKNAFKVVISISSEENLLKISFKDWGIGISKKYQGLIFNLGFRTPEAEFKNVNGSGLGLAICKSIMQELKGSIYLNKNRNPTEFIVSCPIQNDLYIE